MMFILSKDRLFPPSNALEAMRHRECRLDENRSRAVRVSRESQHRLDQPSRSQDRQRNIPCLRNGPYGTQPWDYSSKSVVSPDLISLGMQVPSLCIPKLLCQQLSVDMTLSSHLSFRRSRNRVLIRILSPTWCLCGRPRSFFR